ncbi:MAG: SIR2 family protein [Acidobacteria bacterium]|nr:SIR2 family protein [Acidobacteriota bacterium]
MPIDTNSHEFLLLLRQFEKGQVALFTGAGFSFGVTNSRGAEPPDAITLAQQLAAECNWPYNGEPLPAVYAQAEDHLGTKNLRSFLESLYLNLKPAAWHLDIARLYWSRIYSTNIDDLVEQAYARGGVQKLRSIVCPAPFLEADEFYAEVQCIHLHGAVADHSKPLTFTAEHYAEQTAVGNVWYQQLVEDLQSKSVIFVGTRLNEPPYYHYLRLRSERPAGARELRAKCFIVGPQSSPIMRREFERQGYAVIDATAEEFFAALVPRVSELVHTNRDIVRAKYPHMFARLSNDILDAQAELLRQFDFVSVIETGTDPAPRTMFLLGAEPTWADIAYNIDAQRGITEHLNQVLADLPKGVHACVLMGPAGSGKSTCLRRVAYELARNGHTVYFAKGLRRLELKPLLALSENLGDRQVFVFVDDAVQHLTKLNEAISELPNPNITFVIADQSHLLKPRLGEIKIKPALIEAMPALNDADCEAILDKLDHFGLLGVLTGRPRAEQLNAFLIRSRKQLLVAMKEATSGRGFDIIIAQEYGSLASPAARLAYVVACLVHHHGPPIRRRHLLACLDGTDYERASVLKSQLIDVVIPKYDNDDEYLIPRHRVIARQVVTESAARAVVQDAIVRLIRAIAAEITPQNITRRTIEYQAFRGILQFDQMRLLFGDAYDLIDSVYNEVKPYCDKNFLYWLQRGRLEVHFDHFETAQNYLDASLAIRESYQAWHYVGVLKLKRAAAEPEEGIAQQLAEEGEDILRRQMHERADDSYPKAALIEHKLRYLAAHPGNKFATEVRDLYMLARQALREYPFDEAIANAHEEAYRSYLTLAMPSETEQEA